ncbi:hypothetical protein GCM10009119_34370 [Algoriphagus jejuensis]|uniref:Uncharacterized protein n=1 Tax=Algoriphagus jejuensis TaxID=419934 RepID=A0ABN1N3K1_9BACT
MRHSEEEKEIRGFFQAMKEKDREIPLPDFPKIPKERSLSWWIPAGIAASLAAGFFLLGEKEILGEKDAIVPQNSIGEVIIITLEEGPDREMQFYIEHTTEMDIWESPTASLLTEY